MVKRPLGDTGISVSEIAFGGVEIGIPYGIGVNSAADMLSEKEAVKLLHSATDSGINFFDTARAYGKSEQIMGIAFKDRRDKIVLGTKCPPLRDEKGNLPTGSKLKKTIEISLQESLAALQTDYVDLFMLHQADMEIIENEEIINTFSKLKEKGEIRSTGVSTYSSEETQKAIESGVWDSIQLPFNLMDQRQGELFSLAEEKGVGLVIRSVLMKGLLSNRSKNLHPKLKDIENHIKKYSELLRGEAYNLSVLATKFALSFPEVSSVLVGIDRMEYLKQSLEAVNGEYLSPEKLEWAKQLAYPDSDFLNLPYWDKMNWLK